MSTEYIARFERTELRGLMSTFAPETLGSRMRANLIPILPVWLPSGPTEKNIDMRATVHNIPKILFAVLFFAALGSTGAYAHSHLEHAVPSMNSTVQAPPDRIELSFNEDMEAAFSNITVLDGKGVHFEQGKAEIDSANAKVLRVGLKPMTAGTYKVVWRVMSVDTHRSNGSFAFTVAP